LIHFYKRLQSLCVLKSYRILQKDPKTFTTTAGVTRAGGVARPASGAQLPSANQQRRWIAPSTTVRRDVLPSQEDQLQNDLVFRRIRGILNKITPEKFEKLITDILNIIGNGSNVIFKGVILLIFEKALDEPKYSSMYAQLCKRLSEHAPNLEPPESKITTFKRLLLNKCKDEFENRAAVSATYEKRAGDLSIDEEEARYVAKRKMLGNIKFIGELGKLEMLHDSILHRCAEQLLVGRRKQSLNDQTEDIECLAHLMKTCGRILDSAKAKMRMDQYFDRIRAIINNPEMPTRIKFLLQDVVEMRQNKWMPRKLATPDGPRTIQQVREDAARDGCIYLPQQDSPSTKPPTPPTNQLQEVIFSKIRPKGMEDIFGGPADLGMNLGMGPGVIQGNDNHGFSNGFNSNGGFHHNGFDHGGFNNNRSNGPSFEEKFRENNSNYNNSDQRDYKDNYKKRDNFESKYAERPDFGDRFTANRNKTHPSNRGGRNNREGERRVSPQYESRPQNGGNQNQNGKDLPPRFNKMSFASSGDRDPPPLRPSPNSMMLKPKTPYSLPKSAMAKLDGINPVPNPKIDKVMMTSNEPAVIIQKPASNSKKQNDKKNQGPTREEVFGKIDQILAKLAENSSTNEAFTSWKDANFPAKMVNNALIHTFKQIIKNPSGDGRQVCMEFVDQLYSSDLITAVQVKESLARMVSNIENNSDSSNSNATAELAAWSVSSDKVKLVEVAEMTEGGSSHPLFLSILQTLATKNKNNTLNMFKESNIKLTDQLPTNMRTEEQLGEQLEQRQLSFLVPLLAIKADMWKQLESKPDCASFLAWVLAAVPEENRKDHSFISALIASVVRHIAEQTTLKEENKTPEKEVTDKEKEMIAEFKQVLQSFLTNPDLQLAAVYALQVFCFSRGFPKGMLLRWFVSLYEADIVDEHVFLKWKEDVNDSYPGKGKALFQVNQWLTWLEEAESEEEDEDDE